MRTAFILIVLLFYNFPSLAADIQKGAGGKMVINGKVLSPLCLYHPQEIPRSAAQVDNCTALPEKPSSYEFYSKDNAYGMEWRTERGYRAWLSYSYLGMYGDYPVMLYQYATGGTGRFSLLVQVTVRDNKLIQQRYIAGGDRCHNGIRNAFIEENNLFYELAVTEWHLLNHLEKVISVGFDEIKKSADSGYIKCIGTTRFKNEKFIGIKISK